MALSADTRRALCAYDSFTNFACCPDLPWSPDVYERLDDQIAQTMLLSFCYAWAAGQQAAGVYDGSVADLANQLFDALPTWNESFSYERKVAWTLSLGVQSVLLQSDPNPPAPVAEPVEISVADRDAVGDMAAFFHIACEEATLLFQVGRALGHAASDKQVEVRSNGSHIA
jgi:hypothetical protein